MKKGIPAPLIAAYLGVTPSRIRQIIAAQALTPTGKQGNAKLYDPAPIIRHAQKPRMIAP